MNSQENIWSGLPLSTGIATLVCYAGVFNDVIGIEDMAARLGVSGKDEFHAALNKLHLQGKLILKDGFVGLPDLEDKIAGKASKIATAKRLIEARLGCLRKLGGSAVIKFVGISGSLAANNPTKDRNNHLDIDIFLITRSQCLWLYNIVHGIRNLFARDGQEPELCMNYRMDESNLMITNRNFYTATEVRNLIPVTGLDCYRKFLQINNWVDYYYPGTSGTSGKVAVTPSCGLTNKFCYVLYTLLRCIKWFSLEPLRKISFETDPNSGISFSVLKPRYGGYQALVQKKFGRLAEACFPELLDTELIEKLFPDRLSAEIKRGDIDTVNFSVFNYSKYG